MTAPAGLIAPRAGTRRAGVPAPDADLWARLADLEGAVVEVGNGWRLLVLAVTGAGVYVRTGAGRPTLLSRRALEEALPYVAAGQPLPGRLRDRAARLTAVLRAAGVGPGAEASGRPGRRLSTARRGGSDVPEDFGKGAGRPQDLRGLPR